MGGLEEMVGGGWNGGRDDAQRIGFDEFKEGLRGGLCVDSAEIHGCR